MRFRARQIRRFCFNVLVIVSLLVCAGIVAFWADSYRGLRMSETVHGQRIFKYASRDGVAVLRWDGPPDGDFRWQRPAERFQLLGLAYVDGRLVRRKPWGMLIIPYWMPAMISMVLPIAWVVRRQKQQQP